MHKQCSSAHIWPETSLKQLQSQRNYWSFLEAILSKEQLHPTDCIYYLDETRSFSTFASMEALLKICKADLAHHQNWGNWIATVDHSKVTWVS
jgi:hypothetical protein